MNGESKPNGRYSLIIPNYAFTNEEGKQAAENMGKVAKQQGTVVYKDHSVDNPTRCNEIVAYFFSPLGLNLLKDEAAKALGKPLSDTKGMVCIKQPELSVSIEAEQIEVTGDVRWMKDYFQCSMERWRSITTPHARLSFPRMTRNLSWKH